MKMKIVLSPRTMQEARLAIELLSTMPLGEDAVISQDAKPKIDIPKQPKKAEEAKPKTEEPKKAEEAKPKTDEEAPITVEELRETVDTHVKAGFRAPIVKFLTDHGARNTSTLDAKHYIEFKTFLNGLEAAEKK